MVIQKFNKLIRNKWVWGVFAVLISAFFAFDFLIDDIGRGEQGPTGGAGTLAGEEVQTAEFEGLAHGIRASTRGRDRRQSYGATNRRVWETLAAIDAGAKNGIDVSDDEIRQIIQGDPSFAIDGAFNFERYQVMIREAYGMSPEGYEAFVRQMVRAGRMQGLVSLTANWTTPTELDRLVADYTDRLTVRVATFEQTKAEADAVKLDDAGLKKWYDANTNSLALPRRIKMRMLTCVMTNAADLAKADVTADDVSNRYYTVVSERYTTKDTNGVEVVKSIDEVKAELDRELRQEKAVESRRADLMNLAYGEDASAKEGASRLDAIAKADGLKIVTTDWFDPAGGYYEGFTASSWEIAPGADRRDFSAAVRQLDPNSSNDRYQVFSSADTVWLVECAEESPAHLPSFEDSKAAIRERALAAARADAFKAAVEAIAAKGTNAVLTAKAATVSTNLTFSCADLADVTFPNREHVAAAARKLAVGETSEFTSVGTGRAVLVVCLDRQGGDPIRSEQVRQDIVRMRKRMNGQMVGEAWRKWNLEQKGFKTTSYSSVSDDERDDL